MPTIFVLESRLGREGHPVQITSLARLQIRDLPLQTLVAAYADWLVGAGPFEGQGKVRLEAGLGAIDPGALVEGGDHRHHDGIVRTRKLDDRWALHGIHGDDRGRELHTVVRLANLGDGRVRLEHLTGCARSPDDTALPIVVPKTTRWLIANHARQIEPQGLIQGQASTLDASGADGWLAYGLLEPERESPVVVVSSGPDGVLVEPDALAQKLLGTAVVAWLPDAEASWALRRALDVRGMSAELGCYGGAVRLYRPGFRRGADLFEHPLLLPQRLLTAPPPERLDRVAGLVCRALARDLEAEDWLGTISRIDVRAQRARTEQLVRATEPVAVDHPALDGLRAALVERDEEVRQLRAQLVELDALFEHASVELDAASRRAKDAERERDRFEQEAELARTAAEHARAEMAAAHALERPVDAMRLAARAFGETLLILDSAYRSAETCGFRQPALLFRVLSLLAMSRTLPIHETLSVVCGRQARWKPKDSPQTVKTWGSDRAFTSSTGERVLYESHVTLGHGVKPGANLQIYYRTLTDGRVEVAYVGTHLRTVSHDT